MQISFQEVGELLAQFVLSAPPSLIRPSPIAGLVSMIESNELHAAEILNITADLDLAVARMCVMRGDFERLGRIPMAIIDNEASPIDPAFLVGTMIAHSGEHWREELLSRILDTRSGLELETEPLVLAANAFGMHLARTLEIRFDALARIRRSFGFGKLISAPPSLPVTVNCRNS